MSSVVEISCPECGKALKVPEKILGKKIKCKDCEHAFVAKDPSEEAKKPTKPGVKPSKPGGAAVKPKKEEPKPEPKKEEPPPAAYKFQEDDDDDSATPNPLGVIDEGQDVARCPHCAKELDPPDAKICVHCGFNNLTRVKADSKKVWAPETGDYINHLGPGVLALLLFIGLIVLDIVCWVNMRDWMTDTFLQKDEKDAQDQIAFYVKPGAFITFVIAATLLPVIGSARFAIKRLFIENQPPEKIKK
jgi:hypothetical protein